MPESSKVTVVTEALRDEARKWRRFSDAMEPVQSRVAGLTLDQSAFFVGDANTALHAQVYRDFHDFMVRLLSGAVTEFEQLGGALIKVADAYDNVDKIVDLDLNSLYTE